MTSKLAEGYSADIATALQLSDIFGNRIVQAKLALFDGLREQCGRKHLSDRTKIEDRISRDRPMRRIVSHAVVKERSLAIHPDTNRYPSSLAVFRQNRLNLLRDDLLNVHLRACGSDSHQRPNNGSYKQTCSDRVPHPFEQLFALADPNGQRYKQ
jgi:hypothetical protein